MNLVDSSINWWTAEKIFILVCKGKCTSPHNNKFVSILTKSSIKSWLNILFLALEYFLHARKKWYTSSFCLNEIHLSRPYYRSEGAWGRVTWIPGVYWITNVKLFKKKPYFHVQIKTKVTSKYWNVFRCEALIFLKRIL